MSSDETSDSKMYRLPYFSELSTPNLHPPNDHDLSFHACGITKLLQCRWLGPTFASVEGNIEKLASEGRATKAMQLKYRAVRAVKQANESMGSREGWICVLCHWGVLRQGYSEETDCGDLVFCHSSCRRWLVLETGPIDDEALRLKSKRMGNFLFAMLMYLGIPPEFVRSSTFTPHSPFPPRLLDRSKVTQLKGGSSKNDEVMSCHEIDLLSFEQGLSLSTMERIEGEILPIDAGIYDMVKRDRSSTGHHSLEILKIRCMGDFEVGAVGSEVPSALLLSELKKAVSKATSSAAQPQLDPEGKQESASVQPLVCSCCKKTAADLGLTSLLRCSRCKSSFYCGKACQSEDWRDHKSVCVDRNEDLE